MLRVCHSRLVCCRGLWCVVCCGCLWFVAVVGGGCSFVGGLLFVGCWFVVVVVVAGLLLLLLVCCYCCWFVAIHVGSLIFLLACCFFFFVCCWFVVVIVFFCDRQPATGTFPLAVIYLLLREKNFSVISDAAPSVRSVPC